MTQSPAIKIWIRPTYDSLCKELGYDPTELGDPDKIDPVAFTQGERMEPRAVEPGQSFEIVRGLEGGIGEEIPDVWGLAPGRYRYDGTEVKVVKRFFDDEDDVDDPDTPE
jgi:hypothetical protein